MSENKINRIKEYCKENIKENTVSNEKEVEVESENNEIKEKNQ